MSFVLNLMVGLLWGLLLLKLCWNAMIPVILHRRAARGNAAGISTAPMVEVLLLALLVTFSTLSSGDRWWSHWPSVLGIGFGSVVVSYILMGVAGLLWESLNPPRDRGR